MMGLMEQVLMVQHLNQVATGLLAVEVEVVKQILQPMPEVVEDLVAVVRVVLTQVKHPLMVKMVSPMLVEAVEEAVMILLVVEATVVPVSSSSHILHKYLKNYNGSHRRELYNTTRRNFLKRFYSQKPR